MKPIRKEDYQVITTVDVETLGKASNAKIATIGAAVADVFSGEILGKFYVRCDLVQPERSINLEVTQWWNDKKETDAVAYDEVFGSQSNRLPLHEALDLLSQFITAHYPNGARPQVMGNGSEFDNVILVDAYEQFGIVPPWDFGANQSLRTVVLMGRALLGIDPKYNLVFDGIKHHALDDAIHEALYLIEIFTAFLHVLSHHRLLMLELKTSTDRLDAIWFNLGSMGAKAQADKNRQALEIIPKFLLENGGFINND